MIKDGKYNFINGFGKELSSVWFDDADIDMENGKLYGTKNNETYEVAPNGKMIKINNN